MRIFLSSWSIRDQLDSGKLHLKQLPRLARQHDFAGVELVDRHFSNLSENYFESIISEIKANSIGITLALTTDFSSRNSESLQQQTDYVTKMLNVAQRLQSGVIRILLGGSELFVQKLIKKISAPKNNSPALDAVKKRKKFISVLQRIRLFPILHRLTIQKQKLKSQVSEFIMDNIFQALDELVPLAQRRGISLAIENHWGISTLPENIIQIVQHYHSDYLGTCPDFGNFTIHQNRYKEIEKLLPFAKEVHAKSYQFDRDGNEKKIDYQQCISMLKRTNFEGPLVVEYEGNGQKLQNSLKTRDLILRYI